MLIVWGTVKPSKSVPYKLKLGYQKPNVQAALYRI